MSEEQELNCKYCGNLVHIEADMIPDDPEDIYCLICHIEYLEAENKELKDLFLSFIRSLTLCDHMGDVGNDMCDILERLGLEIDEDIADSLGAVGVKWMHDRPEQ